MFLRSPVVWTASDFTSAATTGKTFSGLAARAASSSHWGEQISSGRRSGDGVAPIRSCWRFREAALASVTVA